VEKVARAILQTLQKLSTNNVKTILILIVSITFSQISLVQIATDTSQVTKTLVDTIAKLTQFLHTVMVDTEHNNTLLLHKVLTFLSTELTEQVEALTSASLEALTYN